MPLELGTSADPCGQKANEDLRSPPGPVGQGHVDDDLRLSRRRGSGEAAVDLDAKRTEGKWRDVRVYDVDHIQQVSETDDSLA